MSFAIEDIKALYNRAQENFLFVDEENERTRKLEAFLVQAALIEGILCQIAFKAMGKDYPCVYGKRKNRYGMENAINDLYLLEMINDEDFKELERFKNARNKYFHTLLEQTALTLENELKKQYEKFSKLLWKLIQKLEKSLT